MIPSCGAPTSRRPKRVLGWEPKVPLAKVLTITIEYFKQKAQRDALSGGAQRTSKGPHRPDQVLA